MNKQRLEQMVTMLRALPLAQPSDFDLTTWRCGTIACAIGHACVEPAFMGKGLTFDAIECEPVYGPDKSWSAVEKFFAISCADAEWLFADWRYKSAGDTEPSEVADRIADFIESNGLGANC